MRYRLHGHFFMKIDINLLLNELGEECQNACLSNQDVKFDDDAVQSLMHIIHLMYVKDVEKWKLLINKIYAE